MYLRDLTGSFCMTGADSEDNVMKEMLGANIKICKPTFPIVF